MEGMSELERIAATLAILRLKVRRDHALDRKDWATYAALHAPDHVSHKDGHDRWPSPEEVVKNLKRLLEGVPTAHHSHTPDIWFEPPTRARGVWSMEDQLFWMQGEEEHWLHGFGFYHETYEKRGGEWVFVFRRLERMRVVRSEGARLGS